MYRRPGDPVRDRPRDAAPLSATCRPYRCTPTTSTDLAGAGPVRRPCLRDEHGPVGGRAPRWAAVDGDRGPHAAVVDEAWRSGWAPKRACRRSTGSASRGPAVGRVAAGGSILNAYYTDADVVLAVWDWLQRHAASPMGSSSSRAAATSWIAAARNPGSLRRRRHRPDLGAGRDGADRCERRRVAHRGVAPRPQRPGPRQRLRRRGGQRAVLVAPPEASANHRDNLHNLVIARSVSMLRPGSVAAVLYVTVLAGLQRHRVAPSAGRRGSICSPPFRLPSRTRVVGTDVVTDLLILRRLPGEQRPESDWLEVEQADPRRRCHHDRQPLLG